MSITGYLVPFPDPGAADLMSDRLEEELESSGPGVVRVLLSLPQAPPGPDDSPGAVGFARKRVLLLSREEAGWATLYDAVTNSGAPTEELLLEVPAAATLRCRVMNMGGTEGQFTLDCAFIPA